MAFVRRAATAALRAARACRRTGRGVGAVTARRCLGGVVALALLAGAPARADLPVETSPHQAGTPGALPLPPGSFYKTCVNIYLTDITLTATCRRIEGQMVFTEIDYKFCRAPLINKDGYLQCDLDQAAASAYHSKLYREKKARIDADLAKQHELEQVPVKDKLSKDGVACFELGVESKPGFQAATALVILGDKYTTDDYHAEEDWFVADHVKNQTYRNYCGAVFSASLAQNVMAKWLAQDPTQKARRRTAVRHGFTTALGRDATTVEAYDFLGKSYRDVVTAVALHADKLEPRAVTVQRAFVTVLGRPPLATEATAWLKRKDYYDQIVAALIAYLYDTHGYPNPEPGYLESVAMAKAFTTALKGGDAPEVCFATALGQARYQRLARAEWSALSLRLPPECLKAKLFYPDQKY